MLQVPTLPSYQLTQPNYNAVKIDIHNPSVGGATNPIAQPQFVPQYAPQYAPVTAPYYSYPQTQLYDYPQVINGQQPYYVPVQPVNVNANASANANAAVSIPQQVQQPAPQPAPQPVAPAVCPPCPPCQAPAAPVAPAVPAPQVAEAAAAAVASVPSQPAPQQVNINQAPQPAPVVTETVSTPAQAPKVEVVPPVATEPQVDLNGFLAKLADPDFEVQANAMEEIANMVSDEAQKTKATDLLDSKIIDALTNIINKDSSKLAGPTQEQIAARQKLMAGQQISDQEKALATTITPMEQAERNKSYAMFTSAILQKLYGDEVAKLTGNKVPLTELPAAMTIVDQLKDNPNPMVRTSAIEALSYIQTPEYKKDLTTLFTIAKNDQDKGVQEAANAALEKLNQI